MFDQIKSATNFQTLHRIMKYIKYMWKRKLYFSSILNIISHSVGPILNFCNTILKKKNINNLENIT